MDDQLTQVLEKIATYNINANTNINIESIVSDYFLFDLLKNIFVASILCGTLIFIAILIYRAWMRACRIQAHEQRKSEMEENIEEILNEIKTYMPRNKNKRKE